jgi:hypothetical protein
MIATALCSSCSWVMSRRTRSRYVVSKVSNFRNRSMDQNVLSLSSACKSSSHFLTSYAASWSLARDLGEGGRVPADRSQFYWDSCFLVRSLSLAFV